MSVTPYFHNYFEVDKLCYNVFTGVCLSRGGVCMAGGMQEGVCMVRGHAWQGACMVGGLEWQGGMCGRGCVWWGGMHGGVYGRGVCMVGGMYGRGHAWQGGVHGRYYEIQLMSGRYVSYCNAFLFIVLILFYNNKAELLGMCHIFLMTNSSYAYNIKTYIL